MDLPSESHQVNSLKKKERHSTETLDLGQEGPVVHLTGDCESALGEVLLHASEMLLIATGGDKVLD